MARIPKTGQPYPWGEWMAPGERTIRRGIDFLVPTYSMAQQVRSKATAIGKGCSLTINGDSLTIRIKSRVKGEANAKSQVAVKR